MFKVEKKLREKCTKAEITQTLKNSEYMHI